MGWMVKSLKEVEDERAEIEKIYEQLGAVVEQHETIKERKEKSLHWLIVKTRDTEEKWLVLVKTEKEAGFLLMGIFVEEGGIERKAPLKIIKSLCWEPRTDAARAFRKRSGLD